MSVQEYADQAAVACPLRRRVGSMCNGAQELRGRESRYSH